jgi:hypothetical protein
MGRAMFTSLTPGMIGFAGSGQSSQSQQVVHFKFFNGIIGHMN